MGKERFVTIGVILVIFLLVGTIIYIKSTGTGLITANTPSEKIAKYIGENSVLYVQAGCIHCKEQEDLFGENLKYLTTVDCFKDTQACVNAGIEATPTWIINNQKYVGVLSIERLKELTGYKEE